MSVMDITIKELFGARASKVVYVLIAGIMIAWFVPKYFVTVPVFAQAMKQMHQQMWVGDRLQEKQWLESEVARLRTQKNNTMMRCGGKPSQVDLQTIADIDFQIANKTARINQINVELQNQWGK